MKSHAGRVRVLARDLKRQARIQLRYRHPLHRLPQKQPLARALNRSPSGASGTC